MRWAREYFNNIRKTAQRAQDLAGIIEYGRIHSSTGGAHGSAISDKTAIEAARVMAAEQLLEQCQGDINKAMLIIRGIGKAFPSDWCILDRYYLGCLSWSQVAREVGMPKSTTHAKALIMISYADSQGMARLREYGERMLKET